MESISARKEVTNRGGRLKREKDDDTADEKEGNERGISKRYRVQSVYPLVQGNFAAPFLPEQEHEDAAVSISYSRRRAP